MTRGPPVAAFFVWRGCGRVFVVVDVVVKKKTEG